MAETNSDEVASGDEASNQQQLAIHKIYLKDASLESPSSPDIFRSNWKPQTHLDLDTRAKQIDEEGNYEIVLRITVTAKVEERTAYLVEIQQAGIFAVQGFDEATHNGILGSYCPSILFPYAREAISDLTAKAGFPPTVLAPVNFDALYAEKLAQQQQQASGDEPE
jgi:preprotein translocase subunit SecB